MNLTIEHHRYLTNDSRLPELSKMDLGGYNDSCPKKSGKKGELFFMLKFLETGQALYVLAGICLLGILTRVMTKNLYKRLIKESANMATTKNKSLKELKQRTENTYRINQGLRDCGAWLDHQLCELRFRGMTLAGWANVSMQLTWLCLLSGGTGAFFSYWYRLDTVYVVMYGGGAALLAMLTMLFDNGTADGKRDLLAASLEDYLENVLCPRLARNVQEDSSWGDSGKEASRAKVRSFTRLAERGKQTERKKDMTGKLDVTEPAEDNGKRTGERPVSGDQIVSVEQVRQAERAGAGDRAAEHANVRGGNGKRAGRNGRREAAATVLEETDEEQQGSVRNVDYLKRSLEQIAASREKAKDGDESWLKELGPDEVQIIGDILKEYLV